MQQLLGCSPHSSKVAFSSRNFSLDVVDLRLVDSLTGDLACPIELSPVRVRACPTIATFGATARSLGGASLCRQQAEVVTATASGRRAQRRAVVEDPSDIVVKQFHVGIY